MEMLPLKVYPRIIFVQSGDAISSDFSSQIGVVIFLEREMLRLQHFYNIFTTNHMWLVVIDSNLKLTLRLLFCPNNNN